MLDNQMRINVVYAGRVQGVGFRATAREIAADFAVTGWVRNQPDGTVLLSFTQAKAVLDRLRRIANSQTEVDGEAWAAFDRTTRQGQDVAAIQRQIAAAAQAVAGKSEERAAASLFTPGGTHARKGEFAGINAFEVIAYLIVTPTSLPGQVRP